MGDTRLYVDSFIAALRQCGHSQADIRRAVLGHVVGDAAPALPTPCVSGLLNLYTAEQMTRYAQDYAAAAMWPSAGVCARSHPHENMDAECERLTVIARAAAAAPSPKGGE